MVGPRGASARSSHGGFPEWSFRPTGDWQTAEAGGSVGAVNADAEGKAYPASTVTVDAQRVRDFAQAVGQTEAGIPPTFLTVAEFAVLGTIVDDPELDLDFGRVVHGEQEYVWHRPVGVGETLVVAPRIAAIRRRGGLGFVTIEVLLSSQDGEPVATARSTMIERPAT